MGDKNSQVNGDVTEHIGATMAQATAGDESTAAERVELTVAQLAALTAKGVRIEADTFTIAVAGKQVLRMEKSGRLQLFGKNINVNGNTLKLRG